LTEVAKTIQSKLEPTSSSALASSHLPYDDSRGKAMNKF